jgi:tRNA pseudouridine13 synthase
LKVPRLDREVGIEVYTTDAQGIGGAIRQFPEDFRVEEVLKDGSKAQIAPAAIPQINDRGRYLICVLVKRNMDTFMAVQKIAEKLGVDQERIQIAGIKDARALTAQHVSIGRMLPEQVTHVKFGNPWLNPLRFSNEKIHSNLLFGNQFHITLRGINYSLSKIHERMEHVRKELLKIGDSTNFFGHQRFGTTRPITHLVGKRILLGEWEKAALTFLAKPSLHEHPVETDKRKTLEHRRL